MSALFSGKCTRLIHVRPRTPTVLRSRGFTVLRSASLRGEAMLPPVARAQTLATQESQSFLQKCFYSGSKVTHLQKYGSPRSVKFVGSVQERLGVEGIIGNRYQHAQVQEHTADIDHAPVIASYPEWIKPQDTLPRRHIGPSDEDITTMLKTLNQPDLDAFIRQTIPDSIRASKKFSIPSEQTPETEMLDELTKAGKANSAAEVDTYIGMGYHPTITPGVIKRNVLENPGWYTSYTPYQPEISQGITYLYYVNCRSPGEFVELSNRHH
jgi:Glycine cleavage system P-protein